MKIVNQKMLLILLFCAIFISITYSLSINNKILSIGGDAYGNLVEFNAYKNSKNFSYYYTSPIGNKDNISIPNPVFDIVTKIISKLSNSESVFYNFYFFYGIGSVFIISLFLSIFLKVENEFKIFIPLLFSLIISFSSYMIMHYLTGHFHFSIVFILLWLFVLYKLFITPKIKTSFILGVVTAANVIYFPYYGYFSMLLLMFILIYVFIFERKIFKRFFLLNIFSGIFALVIVMIVIYPIIFKILTSAEQELGSNLNRTYDSITGILPWMYLFPPINSIISGDSYTNFYRKAMMISNVPENSIYVTFFNLVLCVYGIYLYLNKKFNEIEMKWFRFFFSSMIFCFLISLPPFIPIGSSKIYWISTYLHKIFPMFRIYNRMGILVLIFITLSSLVTMNYLLIKYKEKRKILISVSLVVIILEILPIMKTISLNEYPEVYNWLKDQNGDYLVHEIPQDQSNSVRDEWRIYKYVYYSSKIHGKKILNRKNLNLDLQNFDVYQNLKKWNVKYIIQHKEFYKIGPIPVEQKRYVHETVANYKYNNGKIEVLPKWYTLIKADDNTNVYKVF